MPQVRLNDEVKAVAVITAARAIEKGEAVTDADIAGYKDIVLTEDDPDAGTHHDHLAPGRLGSRLRPS